MADGQVLTVPPALRLNEGWSAEVIETPVGPVTVCWRGDRRTVATRMLRNAVANMSLTHSHSIAR